MIRKVPIHWVAGAFFRVQIEGTTMTIPVGICGFSGRCAFFDFFQLHSVNLRWVRIYESTCEYCDSCLDTDCSFNRLSVPGFAHFYPAEGVRIEKSPQVFAQIAKLVTDTIRTKAPELAFLMEEDQSGPSYFVEVRKEE